MRNLHHRFDWHYIGQIYGRDFAKLCGIYELYCAEEGDDKHCTLKIPQTNLLNSVSVITFSIVVEVVVEVQ